MTIFKKISAATLLCGLLASVLSLPLFAKPSSFPNDLKLTDAFSRPSQTYIRTSISDDGSQVYLLYLVSDTPGAIEAELFRNVNGKLESENTVTLSTTQPNDYFPLVVDGFASSDFKKFSVLDAVITGPNSIDGRIRIFDQNLNLTATRIISFTGLVVANTLGLGGTFSEDGRYVAFTVSYPAIGQTNSTTTLFVLDSKDLSPVAETTINAANAYDASQWVTLECNGKKNYYLTFLSGQGSWSENYETTYKPPYFIQVYKVDISTGSITLVDESPLPKFAGIDTLDLMRLGKKALISHGGFTSLFPNQLSIYDTLYLKTTSLPNDNAESRVLEFDGKKLKVIFKEATNFCNRTLFYPPHKGRTYLVGANTISNTDGNDQLQVLNAEFYVLANIACKNGKKQFVPINLPRQDALNTGARFSNDGKWLIRTGSYGYLNGEISNADVDAIGIRNVLLYRVI